MSAEYTSVLAAEPSEPRGTTDNPGDIQASLCQARQSTHSACSSDLGSWELDEKTRLTATFYSPSSYKAKYLDGPDSKLRRCSTYHKGSRTERGTEEDRQRYLDDMRRNSVPVSADDFSRIIAYTSKNSRVRTEGSQGDMEAIKNQKVALGLTYAQDEVQYDGQDSTAPFHFCRGYMFKGGNNQDMTISGRWPPRDRPDAISTESFPCIDKYVRENFVVTTVPKREFRTTPEGVLVLEQKDLRGDSNLKFLKGTEDSHILRAIWSVPYNDSFYAGAVHEQNPIRLASKRSKDNIVADDETGRLTIFGRESALVLGSGAYETHTTGWSEAYVPTGMAEGQEYGVAEWLGAVKRYTENPKYRGSLTWMSDVGQYLRPGEVVVTSLERKIGDTWVPARDLGALPNDELVMSAASVQ